MSHVIANYNFAVPGNHHDYDEDEATVAGRAFGFHSRSTMAWKWLEIWLWSGDFLYR